MLVETIALEAAIALAKDVVGRMLGALSEQDEVGPVTRALGIEIAELVLALERRRAWWESLGPGPAWLPPLVPFYTEAYDTLKDKVVGLPPERVAAVIRFYGYLRFVNRLQEHRAEYETRGVGADFVKIYDSALKNLIGVGGRSLQVF